LSNSVDTSSLPSRQLPLISDGDARTLNNKGWSFFNVYSLRELRDIYLLYQGRPNLTVSAFFKIIQKSVEHEEKEWSERRVLENLNALKNLKIISIEGDVLQNIFEESVINYPLSINDRDKFKELFFSYFRFNEMSSWFFSPQTDQSSFHKSLEANLAKFSQPIYYLSDNNRFTNTFLYSIEQADCKYLIPDKMSHAMRFWDVFLKWGVTLDLIDKFNISRLAIKTRDHKEISMAYFVRQFQPFNLYSYLSENIRFSTRSIFIPDLIFDIVQNTRYGVEMVKEHIKLEIINDNRLTFERTSEIFIIKGKQSPKRIKEATYLYPIINDNYISHLIIRK